MPDLNKVAAVLEAAADYYEQNEREKTSATEAARTARLDKIAAAHVSTHGEEMPDTVRQKLAKADDASLDVVEALLAKQAGAVPSLGEGASPDNPAPKTVKEAADAADERFLNFILGS
jgi:hypothetical protein